MYDVGDDGKQTLLRWLEGRRKEMFRMAHELRSKVARCEMSSRSPAVTREQYCLCYNAL